MEMYDFTKKEQRDLKFTNRLATALIIVCAFLLLMLSGCRSIQYVPVETIKHDSIYLSTVQHDSVYLKEYINVYQKADTVYKERIITKYKEKLLTDTIYINKVDSVYQERIVEVEKKLSSWQKSMMGLGRIFLGMIILALGYLGFRIFRKIKGI